jgi:hypothetical protein
VRKWWTLKRNALGSSKARTSFGVSADERLVPREVNSISLPTGVHTMGAASRDELGQ